MSNSLDPKTHKTNHSEVELRQITSRIIGAEIEHGFRAVCKIEIVKRESVPGSEFAITCTGTLIAPRLVVFAAHCVERGVISYITVTFNIGGRGLKVRVNPAQGNLAFNRDYKQALIESGTSSFEDKLRMTQRDIAFLVLPKSFVSHRIKPMPMMPMQNLRALKFGGLVQRLTAVGYGRFSNIDRVNRGMGGEKRSAQFAEWSVDEATDIVTIISQRNTLAETGEPVNIAKGDSGGAIVCTYKGVTYLVGVISFYNYVAGSDINIERSFAVGVDLVEDALIAKSNRDETFARLFNGHRQFDAPYGFNFGGMGGAAYKAVVLENDFPVERIPRIAEFQDSRVFKPGTPDDAISVTNIHGVEIFGQVKWFRDPRFQVALACSPLIIYSIMALRIGLEFDSE